MSVLLQRSQCSGHTRTNRSAACRIVCQKASGFAPSPPETCIARSATADVAIFVIPVSGRRRCSAIQTNGTGRGLRVGGAPRGRLADARKRYRVLRRTDCALPRCPEARAHRGRAADVGDREAAEVRHAGVDGEARVHGRRTDGLSRRLPNFIALAKACHPAGNRCPTSPTTDSSLRPPVLPRGQCRPNPMTPSSPSAHDRSRYAPRASARSRSRSRWQARGIRSG